MARVLLLNGPNLDLLGRREPGHYGVETLDRIVSRLREQAARSGHELLDFQSNAEHVLIERIHQAPSDGIAAIIFNPAAYTHTSIALRDALDAVAIPFVEIHISNIHVRESFRRRSYFSDRAIGVIVGCGTQGYELALQRIDRYLKETTVPV